MRVTAGRRTFQGKGTAEQRPLGGKGSGVGETGKRPRTCRSGGRQGQGGGGDSGVGTLFFTQNHGAQLFWAEGVGICLRCSQSPSGYRFTWGGASGGGEMGRFWIQSFGGKVRI